MALFDSGSPVANVALSDTFNTWRVRTNQINTQAAGLASNNTFTGTLNTFNNAVTISGGLTGDSAGFSGPITAPVVTANTVAGNGSSLTALNASQLTAGTIPNARIQITGVTQHQASITGTGALDSGSITTGFGSINVGADAITGGAITGNTGAFSGTVTTPLLEANNINNTSDITLKENIKPAPGITILNVLNPVEFTWKDSGALSYGLIAQELEEILPALVSESSTQGKKTVSYIPLIAVLIKSVQELEQRVSQLENNS